MQPIALRSGEGEALFQGRIVIKADHGRLTITESLFPDAREGADPHFHRRHADSFYVLEGELAVLVSDEETLLPNRAFVCVPPGVVHAFRSTTRARFLNFHTPDGDFAENLRARNRGEPGGFDSFDPPSDMNVDDAETVALEPGKGERLESETRAATIKVGREELALVEFELQPGFEGPEPHVHKRHVDSFYVVAGEPRFRAGDETLHGEPGLFVAAPPGVVHSFSNPGPAPALVVNVHAPSCGFREYLHVMDDADGELDEDTHARYDTYPV